VKRAFCDRAEILFLGSNVELVLPNTLATPLEGRPLAAPFVCMQASTRSTIDRGMKRTAAQHMQSRLACSNCCPARCHRRHFFTALQTDGSGGRTALLVICILVNKDGDISLM
jgi:hypothetical protein